MIRTFGIDVSHWEGDINWQIAANVVLYAILKATDGTSFIDPEYLNNKQGCQNNLLSWGAYHYFHPTQDILTQAQHFVNTVGEGCSVYVCDVETTTLRSISSEEQLREQQGRASLQRAAETAVPADIGDNVKMFLEEVAALTNKTPVIYTSPGFWNTYIGDVSWAQDYPLWVAHWTEDTEPVLPLGWDTWKIWQVTDAAMLPGIPGAVDGDFYNGGLVEMIDYFGNGQLDLTQTIIIRVTAGYLRAAPILNKAQIDGPGHGDVIAYAFPQSKWVAIDKIIGTDGKSYYQVGQNAFILALMCTEV